MFELILISVGVITNNVNVTLTDIVLSMCNATIEMHFQTLPIDAVGNLSLSLQLISMGVYPL